MKKGQVVGALFLAIGFATVSAIMLFVEPGMGFSEPSDYFDPAKVVRALDSIPWLIGDLIYFGMGVVLACLASSSEDRYKRATGFTAAVLIVLVGCFGRVLSPLPDIVTDSEQLEAAVLGAMTARFAALRTMVLALGVFAWRTTTAGSDVAEVSRLGRILGYFVLVASTVFLFVFIPVPLLFTLWAVWLTIHYWQDA